MLPTPAQYCETISRKAHLDVLSLIIYRSLVPGSEAVVI